MVPTTSRSITDLVRLKDWNCVALRVNTHPNEVVSVDSMGFTPLHTLIQLYHSEGNNAVVGDHDDDDDDASHHQMKILNLILDSPLGSEAALKPCHERLSTPLHLCCRNVMADEIILAIAQVNPCAIAMQDEDGDTPLHLAFRYGASDVVLKNLIELGYRAVSRMRGEDAEHEIAFAKADDEDGDLPLHTAISHEALSETVQLLLDAYPQGIFAVNQQLSTPLHIAAVCGRYDIIDVILQSHAVTGCVSQVLNMQDQFGCKPLFILWDKYLELSSSSSTTSCCTSEPLESIAHLLFAAVDSPSASSEFSHNNNDDDDDNDNERWHWHCIDKDHEEGTFNFFPFEQAYRLVLASIRLGDDIVPPAFVTLLIQHHPNILKHADSDGRLPLHIAAIQSYNERQQNPLMDMCHLLNEQQQQQQQQQQTFITTTTPTPPQPFYLPKDDETKNSCLTIIKVILNAYPQAANITDSSGCLPLHLSIKTGMEWEGGMSDILLFAPSALRTVEPNTGLYPFMLAAAVDDTNDDSSSSQPRVDVDQSLSSSSSSSLETVFLLLRNSPDLVTPCKSVKRMRCQTTTPTTTTTTTKAADVDQIIGNGPTLMSPYKKRRLY